MAPESILAIAISSCSLVFSVAAALAAGRYRLREKELELRAEAERRSAEFYETHRAEVIERYVSAAGAACCSPHNSLARFWECQGELYFYVDSSLWPLLNAIGEKLMPACDCNADVELPFEQLALLCQKLAESGVRKPGQRKTHRGAPQ